MLGAGADNKRMCVAWAVNISLCIDDNINYSLCVLNADVRQSVSTKHVEVDISQRVAARKNPVASKGCCPCMDTKWVIKSVLCVDEGAGLSYLDEDAWFRTQVC